DIDELFDEPGQTVSPSGIAVGPGRPVPTAPVLDDKGSTLPQPCREQGRERGPRLGVEVRRVIDDQVELFVGKMPRDDSHEILRIRLGNPGELDAIGKAESYQLVEEGLRRVVDVNRQDLGFPEVLGEEESRTSMEDADLQNPERQLPLAF